MTKCACGKEKEMESEKVCFECARELAMEFSYQMTRKLRVNDDKIYPHNG